MSLYLGILAVSLVLGLAVCFLADMFGVEVPMILPVRELAPDLDMVHSKVAVTVALSLERDPPKAKRPIQAKTPFELAIAKALRPTTVVRRYNAELPIAA